MKKLRIGLLAHQFLINIGANDFLKNIIRGLSQNPDYELIFLVPTKSASIASEVTPPIARVLKNAPRLKSAMRWGYKKVRPIVDKPAASLRQEYDFYLQACPQMKILPSDESVEVLRKLIADGVVDFFMPSIFPLPSDIPHLNYWPDCQPKRFPEFFDDESQRVRDERIKGLLDTGYPLIINSRDAKQDMIRFYDADPKQIFDLPFAPIIEFDRLVPRPELIVHYDLKTPYFLVSNQFWIHKNLETVLNAVRISKEEGVPVQVYFTGKMEEPRKPGYIDDFMQLIRKHGLEANVRLFGLVPKEHQIEIMKRAVAVIQPSMFEGGPGGGSVYDATSLGVRSIVSNIPVNLELPTCGTMITTFETGDPKDLLDKMRRFERVEFVTPDIESLYQNGLESTQKLSDRLSEALDYSLSVHTARQ